MSKFDEHPEQGFRCIHCRRFVTLDERFSGVHNRNHCPYCLWSRHMDLITPGDRLAACKSAMRPVGLTFKRRQKKYSSGQGELMLIHQCTGCGRLSINRTAADDDAETTLAAFEQGRDILSSLRERLDAHGITPLHAEDFNQVRLRLRGWAESLSAEAQAMEYA